MCNPRSKAFQIVKQYFHDSFNISEVLNHPSALSEVGGPLFELVSKGHFNAWPLQQKDRVPFLAKQAHVQDMRLRIGLAIRLSFKTFPLDAK
jgi:hypothetical protein